MPGTVEWKIFYGDGRTYSDGPPEYAPKQNVQVIAVRDEVMGRRLESSEDFYIWTPENGGWRGANWFRLAEYLMEPGSKVVLFGRTLSDDEYRAVFECASRDCDLPPKSGFSTKERRP